MLTLQQDPTPTLKLVSAGDIDSPSAVEDYGALALWLMLETGLPAETVSKLIWPNVSLIRRFILVGGKRFGISENLATALKKLEQATDERVSQARSLGQKTILKQERLLFSRTDGSAPTVNLQRAIWQLFAQK